MGWVAAIGAVASVAGGLLSKSAKKKEAKRITAAGEKAVSQLTPFSEGGVTANQAVLDALGQGEEGAGDAAFQNFLSSTGFQAELAQGSTAITGNQAAAGLLNSGSTLKRLRTFGQDLAQTRFQNFLGNLQQVAGRGAGTATTAAGITSGTGTQAAQTRGEGDSALISGIGSAFNTALFGAGGGTGGGIAGLIGQK